MKKTIQTILLASMLAACASFGVFGDEILTVEDAEAALIARKADSGSPADYKFVEEDLIQIDVWGEPQLTRAQVQITPDGCINVAYIGKMKAEGLTAEELSAEIAKRLEDAGILINPLVQVTIIKMHEPTMRVFGEVHRPGSITFKDGDTVLDAIAQAGSFTEDAYKEKVTITPKDSPVSVNIDMKRMLSGDLSQNYPLRKGDTIYVPAEDLNNKIYVFGEVLRPGMYEMKEHTTLLTAISLAGGPKDRADLKRSVIIRTATEKPVKVECNMKALFTDADLSQDLELMPGDTVVIPETKRPNWTTISQIISALSNISYIRRTGLF